METVASALWAIKNQNQENGDIQKQAWHIFCGFYIAFLSLVFLFHQKVPICPYSRILCRYGENEKVPKKKKNREKR